MISNIILSVLENLQVGGNKLKKGTNLFAETASNKQHVVVSTTNTKNLTNTIVAQRFSSFNAQVVNFSMEEGYKMAERIFTNILAMAGTYTYTHEDGVVETYNVKSILPLNLPSFASGFDNHIYTMNFEIYYTFSIS